MSKALLLSLGALLSATALGQDKLTLQDALKAANANNGTVMAARLSYEAAQASTKAAYSAFLPTLTPSYQREDGYVDNLTGSGKGRSDIDSSSSQLTASWLLFDNGGRSATYSRARLEQEQTLFQSLDTYRSVLFTVHSSFYDALRAQQLLKVSQSSLERALKLQDAAEKREEVGAGPKKDILQARADALNAQVSVLTATNQVSTSLANLRAVLGWPNQQLPVLDDSQMEQPAMVDYTLEQALKDGLAARPSLLAARKQVDLSKVSVQLAKLDTSVSFQAKANYIKSFSDSQFDRPTLSFVASFPLFDGFNSKENLRVAELSLKAQEATYTQTERDVTAEIEAAYKAFKQDFDLLSAAKLARDAAQENYNAASGAYKEGAGTILDQLTAQVSLATAESNYVQAYYDLQIAEVKLRQVTGKSLPGEVDGE